MRPTDGRVVLNFIVQALTGEPLSVYGYWSQIRSCCYITDMVDRITKLLFAEPTNTQGEPQIMENSVKTPVNLGNPYEFWRLQK